MTRRALAFLAAAAALTALAADAAPAASPPSACARIREEARTATADEVAFLFVASGVLRVHPGCAYDLITPKLRKRMPRSAFVSGTAVELYKTRRPKAVQAQLTPRVRIPTQAGSWITLHAPDRKPRTFEIVLVKRDGRWLVDYWAHAVGFD